MSLSDLAALSAVAALAVLTPLTAEAAPALNIPVGSWVYDDLERLELKGAIKSALLSTKPLNRKESARLVGEAAKNVNRTDTGRILRRLARNTHDDSAEGTYLKPLDGIEAKFLYSGKKPYFHDANNKGVLFSRGANLVGDITVKGGFLDSFAFYVSPEFALNDDFSRKEIVYGYGVFNWENVEVLAGKDSLWWGPGKNGALLVSDNAKPFTMVKVSAVEPFVLPWALGSLGLFKPTVFLARLEKERDFPRADLLGMRFDFKLTENLQVGLSRVFMFGGEGRRSLGLTDWVKAFFVSDGAEHGGSPVNGNQIASIDASYVYRTANGAVPFSAMKLYTEWGAEDSSGTTRTPTGRANICGALVDEPLWLKDVDLRVEWANTARNERYGPSWYKHGTYTSGYTHEGRVMGHHMGGDSQDLFARARFHGDDYVAGLTAERQRSNIHSAVKPDRKKIGVDLRYHMDDRLTITGGLAVEKIKDQPDMDGYTSNSFWLKAERAF